ncbi:hypothetical protein LguiA_004341 [Lonicera macranthoides]
MAKPDLFVSNRENFKQRAGPLVPVFLWFGSGRSNPIFVFRPPNQVVVIVTAFYVHKSIPLPCLL